MIIKIISKLVSYWRQASCVLIGCAVGITPVHAEYYLVYDTPPCSYGCGVVEHHHYYHKAKKVKKAKVHKTYRHYYAPRYTYKVEVFYPSYVCEGSPCSPCGSCYQTWTRVQCFEGRASRVYTSQPAYYRDYGYPPYSQDQRTGDDVGAELQVNY